MNLRKSDICLESSELKVTNGKGEKARIVIINSKIVSAVREYQKTDHVESECPQCNESKGEKKIRLWLEKNNIPYKKQEKFDNCRDIKPLPFDFYLPTFNIAIEYDGRQHFEPIEFFGGQEYFESVKMHDGLKNEYCKNNGIPLLRIPYFKFDNIEEELNNFLFI